MQQSPVAPGAADSDDEVDPPADLRLFAPAVGAELGAVAGLLLPGRTTVVLLAVALAGLVVAWRKRPRTPALVAGAFLLVFAGSLAGAGLRVESRASGPVAALAAREAAVTATVVLTDDPRPTGGSVRGDALGRESVVAEARLVRLRAGSAEPVRVRQPVLVIASDQGWRGLLPSQRVEASGRLVAPRGNDLAAVLLVRGGPENVGPPSWEQRQAGGLRAGLRRASASLPADARGLLPGLVVGDTSGMSDELRADAREAGLSHLTAVSGANCAIVLALVLAMVRPTPLGRTGRSVLAVVGLAGFVVLARPSPSVLRAALMGLIALLALALGRRRAAMPALLGAITLLVLADPDLALEPGFVLSVLATGSLLTLAPSWADAFARRMPRWLAQALAVPLAAQAAVTPVVVLLSGSISLVAVPANLLAAPAVPVATVAGVVAAVLAPVTPTGAHLAAAVGGYPCSWIAAVAHRAAWTPHGAIGWPRTALGVLLAALVVVLLVVLLRHRRSRRLFVAALVGVLLATLLLPRTGRTWPPPDWTFLACDVGQGDATLIRGSPADPPVLVDAGPDPRALRTCLDGLGVDRLSAVELSHLHADHVEGLPAVLGRIPTAAVFVNPWNEPAGEQRRVRGWAARAGLPLTVLSAGQRWTAGGVQFEVIGPARVLRGTESDPNNNSTVLLAQAHGLSVLLTGDVETDAQAALLSTGVPRADVLKVPHHGSADQDPRFLAAVGARAAVASVGADNPYGHPSPRTLDLLERAGSRTLRTDRDGSVAFAQRDGDLDVRPSKRGDHLGPTAVPADPAVQPPVSSVVGAPSVPSGRADSDRGRRTPVLDLGPASPRPRARSPPLRPGVHRSCRDATAVPSDREILDVMPPTPRSAAGTNPGPTVPPPLTVVTGDEDLLVARAIADVLAAAQIADPEAAAEDYPAGAFTAEQVLELRNPPLFGGTRVVIVRGLNELGDEVLDALLATAEQPMPEVLIIGVASGRERKQVAALRKLAGPANVRSAAKITRPKDRRTFVMDEAKRVGVRLTDAAVWALLDSVGADLRSLSGAITQLRDAAGPDRNPRAPLDEDDVSRLFRGKAETRGFAVSDAVIAGDTAAALSLLRSAIETGLDPVPIVSVIASSLRDLARVVGETSSGRSSSRAELARRLGMPDWKLDKVQGAARQWSDAALSRALQAAAEADAGVKGAAADPVYVVERLVLTATSARNGRAALAAGGVRR